LFLPIERKFTRGLADHEFLIQRQDDVRVPAAHKIPLVLILGSHKRPMVCAGLA
jgi:hypothetical protein